MKSKYIPLIAALFLQATPTKSEMILQGGYDSTADAYGKIRTEHTLSKGLDIGVNGQLSSLIAADLYGRITSEPISIEGRAGYAAGDISVPYAAAEFELRPAKGLGALARGIVTGKSDDNSFVAPDTYEGLLTFGTDSWILAAGYGAEHAKDLQTAGPRIYGTYALNDNLHLLGGIRRNDESTEGFIALGYSLGGRRATLLPLFPTIQRHIPSESYAPRTAQPSTQSTPNPLPPTPPPPTPPITGGESGGDLIDPQPPLAPISGGESGGDLITQP